MSHFTVFSWIYLSCKAATDIVGNQFHEQMRHPIQFTPEHGSTETSRRPVFLQTKQRLQFTSTLCVSDEVKQTCLESSDQVVRDSGANLHHQTSTLPPTSLLPPKLAHNQKLLPTSHTGHREQKQEGYRRKPLETEYNTHNSRAAILSQLNLTLTCICVLIVRQLCSALTVVENLVLS